MRNCPSWAWPASRSFRNPSAKNNWRVGFSWPCMKEAWPMAELRARLRAATGPFHERVDAAYANFSFAQPGGYARFLRAHGRVLGSMEVALEQAGIAGLLDDWPARVRRHALLADLATLGSSPPMPLPPPELPDIASCWGAAYVLEGSRLG